MPPCNDNDDDDVKGDNRSFEGHINIVKPGLHHATELGVQANQVVCESRFLMFFFYMTLSFVNKVFEMPVLSEQVQNI